VTRRRVGRTSECVRAEADRRIADARAFLAAAEHASDDQSGAARDVVVSNAVLAGIAAADVICCTSLQRRSASGDHNDAAALLKTVVHVGEDAAKSLVALLSVKGKAEYLPVFASPNDAKVALRQARRLLDHAERART
jgi:hypothetical protein